MLVLTRKTGQAIDIGPDIRIFVLARRGSRHIRLGIDAPRSIPISQNDTPPTVTGRGRVSRKEGGSNDSTVAHPPARR
jgi:carbon storage regulator CsrA